MFRNKKYVWTRMAAVILIFKTIKKIWLYNRILKFKRSKKGNNMCHRYNNITYEGPNPGRGICLYNLHRYLFLQSCLFFIYLSIWVSILRRLASIVKANLWLACVQYLFIYLLNRYFLICIFGYIVLRIKNTFLY